MGADPWTEIIGGKPTAETSAENIGDKVVLW